MKKIILVLSIVALALTSCTSDSSESATSEIFVDAVQFKPTRAKVENATSSIEGETGLLFTLEKGQQGTTNYEAIVFRISYPLTSSSAPNGVYDFGIGLIGEMLFANGSYIVGNDNAYGLAGYTVKVTALGNDKYKLEFQNIQAISLITSTEVIISGSYEGKFQ